MFKAFKSLRSVSPAHRPVTVCAVLLSSIVLTAGPAIAQQLSMDHENVTVEPIEEGEDSPEVSNSAFESMSEEQPAAGVSEPMLDESEASPAAVIETSHETAVDNESAAGQEKVPAIEAEPALHESYDTGPEVEPQTATESVPDPFAPAESAQPANEVAADAESEPVGIDPLMEAAEAHDEAGGDEDASSETVAAEPAKAPAQAAAPAAADASKSNKESVKVAAVAPEKKTDIYDQWAHSKFKARKEKAPHPLAMQHPDNFVVVCEAGCAENPVEIVYMERRDARGPVNEKPLKAGIVAGTEAIDCVGGCYERRNSYGAIAATWDPSATVTESEWMTTVKKAGEQQTEKKEADSSSRWYERIN